MFGRLDSLFWRKNRVKETRAGVATGDEDDDDCGDEGDEAASALTRGEGTLVGNPAALLSRRRRAASRKGVSDAEDLETNEARNATSGSADGLEVDVLDQLRGWKIEMAETFSRLAAERRGGDRDPDRLVSENRGDPAANGSSDERDAPPRASARFAPQPPAAPKPPPPRASRRSRPGRRAGRGARRGARAAGARRPAKTSLSSALAETGPESVAARRRRNPTPASRPAVERLVLE